MKKKIDPSSEDKNPSSLDLFSSKNVLIGIQNSTLVEYNPLNPPGTWPVRFSINSGLSYLDLSKSYLVTTFRLQRRDITKTAEGKEIVKHVPVTKDDKISFINGFGATAIKNLKVLFNGRQIYNSTDLYSYNAYLRRRLGLQTSRSEDHLQLAGYFEDGDVSQVSGNGFEKRRKFFEGGSDFHTVTDLDVDFFKQNRLLLNEMTVDIEITPQSPAFALISQDDKEYWYQVKDYKLYVKQDYLIPQLDESIQTRLKGGDLAKYPYTRNLVNNFFISPGRHDFKTTLFNDFIPKRVFVALVDGNAFNGTTSQSPFEFKTFGLQNIQLSANGKLLPAYPYDLTKKELGRPFKDLVNATEGVGLTYEKYLTHSTIFAFDFQSIHAANANELQDVGTTNLSLRFEKAVPAGGLQAIIYAEFDSLLTLDFNRTPNTALPV